MRCDVAGGLDDRRSLFPESRGEGEARRRPHRARTRIVPTTDAAILFLCVANSARSQIAEAVAREIAPAGVEVFSAGARSSRIHPFAVRVLDEIGIDASGQYPKTFAQVPAERISMVVTLCAEDVCPSLPAGVRRLEWPVDDPSAAGGSDQEVLESFRRVRDLIRAKVVELFSDESGR